MYNLSYINCWYVSYLLSTTFHSSQYQWHISYCCKTTDWSFCITPILFSHISLSLSLSLSRTGTCMHTHTNKTSVEVVRFLNIHYHTQLQDPTLKGATNATSISWVRMSWDYVISNCRKWNCDFGIYLQWPYINMRFHINWFRSCKVKNTDSTVTSYASLYIQEYGPGIY